jgi:uncharacterized peroxidase-related enzyme
MTRIAPIPLDEADPRTAATLAALRAKLGRLPNLVTTLARSPSALEGYLGLSESLARGTLTARQRELIAIAVAEENGCEYCLSAHAAIGRAVGLSPREIEQARDGEASDPAEDAVTRFALEVVRTRGGVGDAPLQALRRAGADDGRVLEVVANVALNLMTNYVNRVAGTRVDFPVIARRRAA